MLKKIMIILGIVFTLAGVAYSDELVKVNSINFDNSDGLIFITASSSEQFPNTNVSLKELENPKRVYFDINNAVLTMPNRSVFFEGSDISQIKFSQFSISPHVVRVAIYVPDGLDIKSLNVVTFNNNIVIKLPSLGAQSSYFNQVYYDKPVGVQYYERARYVEEDKLRERQEAQALVKPVGSQVAKQGDTESQDGMFTEIQKALNDVQLGVAQEAQRQTVQLNQKTVTVKPQPKFYQSDKEKKLLSKYYINRVDTKYGNILINGVGQLAVEKPIYLSSPTRVVFDLPNTVVAGSFRNKDILLSERETARLGQFEPGKARLVIQTPEPQKYRAIYSFDLQSVLIGHDDRLAGLKLFDKSAELSSYRLEKGNELTDLLYLNFENPIIHSVKRDNNKLEVNLYNSTQLPVEELKKVLKSTNFSDFKVEKFAVAGSKLTVPISSDYGFEYWQSQDAKKLILKITAVKSAYKPQSIITNRDMGLVVIDPGHGGSETGAIREGILEKDINIDVSKRVMQILVKNGVQVEMTRYDDQTVSLSERVAFSDERSPVCFVSVHVNSSVSDAITGVETHYYRDDSYELAKFAHKSLAVKLNTNDRGLFRSKFYVVNHTKSPAVLVEIGFISNAGERKQLMQDERRQKTAEAIAEGIIQYVKTQVAKGDK